MNELSQSLMKVLSMLLELAWPVIQFLHTQCQRVGYQNIVLYAVVLIAFLKVTRLGGKLLRGLWFVITLRSSRLNAAFLKDLAFLKDTFLLHGSNLGLFMQDDPRRFSLQMTDWLIGLQRDHPKMKPRQLARLLVAKVQEHVQILMLYQGDTPLDSGSVQLALRLHDILGGKCLKDVPSIFPSSMPTDPALVRVIVRVLNPRVIKGKQRGNRVQLARMLVQAFRSDLLAAYRQLQERASRSATPAILQLPGPSAS
jgi:hypothetical protein